MPKAFIAGSECRVLVDRDLGESWAVTVVPPPEAKGQPPRTPMVVKLQGNDRAAVTKGALEILQQQGRIDGFEL